MQFTRLRLNGFKSFVDPTDLIIASGLTGVVGPNGCGKSNLLEALRWVMGETRPSAMRGGGMEDVVFAGAATRPARNFAEVSLTLDNSERLAPAGFNDTDMLDIVRRITRDAGSAYKVAGKDVRARDVQMLFADASTGAHSPALVRQGQISELINAKPTARRRILEEAAGISGLYQRRHEAELKLKATESNLARVEDVVEQLSGQLQQLARQARQAARYRSIGLDLRAAESLLLFRRWKEADEAHNAARTELTQSLTDASRSEGLVREADRLREESEEALPPLREEEAIAAAILQRLLVQRDTLSTQEERARQAIVELEARLAQLGSDKDRESGLTRDAGETIARYEEELRELAAAAEGHDARLAASQEEAQDAARVLEARESDYAAQTEDMARLAAQHQSVERLLSDSRKTLARNEEAAETARAAASNAVNAVEKSKEALSQATAARATAQSALEKAEDDLASSEDRRARLQSEEAESRASRSAAEGESKALSAEVAALTRLVARESGEGPQILDDVRVDGGLEKALGAALGDDLKSARTEEDGETGWAALPPYDASAALPEGAVPLSEHVAAPRELDRRLSQVGVVAPDRGAALQPLLNPGQRLVSAEGDLWRWDGLRAAAEDTPSAAALRLEQRNRLETLQASLRSAQVVSDAARESHSALTTTLSEATQAEKAAREARRSADAAVADTNRACSRAEADQNLAEGRVESLALAVSRHEDEAAAARFQVREAEEQARALPDLEEARGRSTDLRTTVEAARLTMMTKRSVHDEFRRTGETRVARDRQVRNELANWQNRLSTADSRISELVQRLTQTGTDLTTARAAPDSIAQELEKLAGGITTAQGRKAAAEDSVSTAESRLRSLSDAARSAEKTASDAREARARAETRVEAASETLTATVERIREDLDQTPEALVEGLDTDPDTLPPSEQIEATVGRLKRQREALGAVNLRAEEDAREVQEEHDTLVNEIADLESAVEKLRSGIAGLNREGRERLLTAFEQVNSNFSTLFTHLFGGGEAKLVLVESDDPLEAGLEIMCQPPGKKLSTLSLLSGGEQTLTAMALIFGVFLANPAPICVLDEVDAPLDDANVTRFCDLLDEMTRRTQTRFLIITHHAVTMSRMDRLFGVTMQEQGVSQLVSVDLKKAEAMVA